MENNDRTCNNCGYWMQANHHLKTGYGYCTHTGGKTITGNFESCGSFASRFAQDPYVRIRDLENEIDRLATRRAQLEHVHREDTDTIERLHEGCAFYSKRIAEQETTIARLTIGIAAERDDARAALAGCESNFGAWRKEMDQTIKFLKLDLENVRVIRQNELIEHAREMDEQDRKIETLIRERDKARAQVDDLSAEVVKMTEEIRQLRGMIP